MANKQLVDYIAQQLKNNVSMDAIKNALLGAGWSESDITEAVGATESGTVATPSVKSSSVVASLASTASSQSAEAMAATAMGKTTDIKSTLSNSPSSSGKTNDPVSAVKMAMKSTSSSFMGMGMFVALVLVIVALIGLSGYLYQQNQNLSAEKMIGQTGVNQSMEKLANLQKGFDDVSSTLKESKQTNDDLLAVLQALSPAKAGVSASQEIPVSVKGVLSQSDGTTTFSLNAAGGIVFTVKNSKDQKIIAALSGILGQTVELTGTHVPGSVSIKVLAVNGTSLE